MELEWIGEKIRLIGLFKGIFDNPFENCNAIYSFVLLGHVFLTARIGKKPHRDHHSIVSLICDFLFTI